MKIDRVMIAAPKSGSGKTTVACALLRALSESGRRVSACKCGPDYIDPMFHRDVIGVPSKNLDTFFTGEAGTRRLFAQGRTEGELVVMEGVMGLFDGLGGVREEGSTYHLAKVTQTPILLTVDAKGMGGRSALAVVAGFLAYDTERLIRGVLFNRMSRASYETVAPLLEKELGIAALGCFPEQKGLHLESRRLGLVMPEEIAGLKQQVALAARELQKNVSIGKIMEIAAGAPETEPEEEPANPGSDEGEEATRPVIAVAKDRAFCFYYEDNLRLLERCGARLVFFSPLCDRRLPEGCDGLLLGGGYPELYADKLAENKEMLFSVRTAVREGMPVVAECGGFLYLHETLRDPAGVPHRMAGIVPGECHDTGKLVRFGYVELTERREGFLPEGTKIRGHEFHYYDSERNGEDCLAVKPATGRTYPCVIAGKSFWLGFAHLYYPSNPVFAERFVRKAGEYRAKNQK
ncbi:MAG: cobyrinate a,c-diamide synthase [Eubacteriales bacterium]|nr:cobyrinate a,c-diamide synthase [Eubacteriales bacterium]